METTAKSASFNLGNLIEMPELKVGVESKAIWEIGAMLVLAIAVSGIMIVMTKKAFSK
ncbi:MAG: hypothetical protein LBN27_11120 [Prevotellaceae bacterium]|jgi:hypothetical protein|nr:hypothetical protein [Prevotellaceae bacterium]